jgi:hypothetical protein
MTYSQWRDQVARTLTKFQHWLIEQELGNTYAEVRLAQLLERLKEDRLHVAFVAEFSRGKSELINSIFFADYGNRVLPSSVGRTTMCPTELLYNAKKMPCIDLLPIQTRRDGASLGEYRHIPNAWQSTALDITSAEVMKTALSQVCEVMRVSPDEAASLGFALGSDRDDIFHIGEDGLVEIPRWRHAIINYPHPMLKQGLVILDTPGLNAIGAEPELTLSLLPRAHAVLFILAADTGVTRSDLSVWQKHIDRSNGKRGRLVVLNKIDGLWDALKSEAEIEAEIAKQVRSCADTLNLEAQQVFPVSAQKGLAAKINGDMNLLERSRLPKLEKALSCELIPAKQDIVRDDVEGEFNNIHAQTKDMLASRVDNIAEQLSELANLRGKNKGMIHFMMDKARLEKQEFEAGLQRYHAARSVFSRHTNQLFAHLGLSALQTLIRATRETMLKAAFSRGLSKAMQSFFASARGQLKKSSLEAEDIYSMTQAVYKQLVTEFGVRLPPPATFSLLRYERELSRLETWCATHLDTALSLLTKEKRNLTHKFFAEISLQVYRAFEHANYDAEAWLRTIMTPVETQVRERQSHLKQRLENIRRVLQASDALEERISELEEIQRELAQQLQDMENFRQRLHQHLWPQEEALAA